MREEAMKINEKSEPGCHRSQDLVTYLYEEATPTERRSFEDHLRECRTCSTELAAFSRVRKDLGAWEVGLISQGSPITVSVHRNTLETLRDLIGSLAMWPVWARFAGATAAAALVLVFGLAIAGTRIDLNARTVSFSIGGWSNNDDLDRKAVSNDKADFKASLTRQEIESMIAERVAAATADERKREEDLRARIASLSAKLANASQSQARLGSALATLRTEQRALASRGQSTLGEWLFATNGSRETWGVDNERDN